MLSIVKIDLDCHSGSLDALDEADIKEEVEDFLIEVEPIVEEDVLSINKLQLTPIVYTTRLDDMTVLKSNLLSLHPQEVTTRILKESKPKLHINPIKDDRRCGKTSFRSVQTKLHEIYHEYRTLEKEELDIKPDLELLKIDHNLIKSATQGEPNANNNSSELLKQCRLFSIELSKVDLFQTKSQIRNTNSKSTKCDDSEMVIWAKVTNKNGQMNMHKVNNTTFAKYVLCRLKGKAEATFSNFSGNRLLTSGLMEIQDPYSKRFNAYGTDPKGQLIDFYTDNEDNMNKYQHIRTAAEARMAFKSCCWVRRDEYIQSLYPRVLLYSNLRFIKTLHTCPPGECVCCCRKKEDFDKPHIDFTDEVSSLNPPADLKTDVEIQALEDEIHSSIIEINKAPRLNTTEWLRNLLNRPSNKLPMGKDTVKLLDKALTYKPPIPKKQNDNRHLLTIKQETSKSGVIVFRNFAKDEREIFELNSNGEIQSYIKSTCFNNIGQPNVKKLSQKSKSVHEVCCWFKRENVITELVNSKSLHPSAVKFIRIRHTCLSEKCSCCCEPKYDKEMTLTDISFPKRPNFWSPILKDIETETKQPNTMSQTGAKVPPAVGMKVVLPTMSVARPNINSGLNNINNAYANSTNIPLTPALPTDHQYCAQAPGPSSIFETTTTKNDDDCEIVSVTPASTMTTQPNLVPTGQVIHLPEIVNCDAISEEVNSMIASILERFKDVRLTINSNGKVSAAINTPINTLSTVEIKVLASILSYAQSQVNLLGVHSGMSLSSFISQSANINNITQPPSGSGKTSESNFNVNVQIFPQSSDAINNSIDNTESTTSVGYPDTMPQMQLPPTKEKVVEHFSKSATIRNHGFHDSFASFLATKAQNETNTFKPVIANVFSLKDQENTKTAASNDTSTSTVWYRKPGNQTSSLLTSNESKNYKNVSGKRKQDEVEKASKRLRVLSPSKLGVATVAEPNKIINTFFTPIPVLESNNVEVLSRTPGVPLLANDQSRFVSIVNSKPKQGGNKPGIIPPPNPQPVSAKTLVVGPLSTVKADANVVGKVTVPVTVESEASEDTEMSLAQAYDAPLEEDCILGI